MKIAVFSDSFLPYCSGVTYAVLAQVQELCRRGHQVTLFRARPPRVDRGRPRTLPTSATLNDVPLSLPVPRLPKLRLAMPTVWTSHRRLKQDRPDVVHVHTEWGCGWEGMATAKLLGVPVVGTFHTFFADPGYLRSLGLPPWRWIQSVMWRYAVSFFNRCDAVTSPSDAVRKSLLSHGVHHPPQLISNGIQRAPRPKSEFIGQLRERYGVEGVSFIYVGRLAPEKSLDVLLDAFARVLPAHPQATLVIIGDGPSRPSMDRQITQLGIDDRVKRLGFVPHEELINAHLLQLGDAFVTASQTENQPMSVLEAMAAGLPIVGPLAKGLAEMITPGENGLGCFAGDADSLAHAMQQVAVAPEQCLNMGRRATEYAQQHSLSSAVDRLEALYVDLARAPSETQVAAGIPGAA